MCLKKIRVFSRSEVLILVSCLVSITNASIAIENVDIDLSRKSLINSQRFNQNDATITSQNQVVGNNSLPAGDVLLVQPVKSTTEARHIPDDGISGQAANSVPIYRSAPKQIEALDELNNGARLHKSPAGSPLVTSHDNTSHKSPANSRRHEDENNDDLNHAAAGHYKKHKKKRAPKKKVKIVKKKKKKKVVAVKKKVVSISEPMYHHKRPKYKIKHRKKKRKEKYHHHHPVAAFDHKAPSLGEYYEYREVPEKSSWKYGFKRGNDKHLIERSEYKHKSHFNVDEELNRRNKGDMNC